MLSPLATAAWAVGGPLSGDVRHRGVVSEDAGGRREPDVSIRVNLDIEDSGGIPKEDGL